jgi:hypothetical protein
MGVALAGAPAIAQAPPTCRGHYLSDISGLPEARAKRADDLANADGLLWRIDRPSLPPSYLFGTIHSTDDDALAVARRAAETISGAKVVATELGGPMDAMEKAGIGADILARALDRDHDTFADVPAEDRAGAERLVYELGYPTAFAHHLRLWFLAVLTATPMCEVKRLALDLPEVDQFLAEQAKAAGVRVVALETPQEQLDAIASLRPEIAAALLAVAARDPAANDDVYVTLLKLYRESRPAEILAVGDSIGGITDRERAAEDAFASLLLTGRNATMAERLAPLLKDGGAFIAVGALHLTGRDGLVERLRGLGYAVTKVW